MSLEIAWKQNILVTDFHLLKSLLVVFGFGSQAFICGFSRQNICSVVKWSQIWFLKDSGPPRFTWISPDKVLVKLTNVIASTTCTNPTLLPFLKNSNCNWQICIKVGFESRKFFWEIAHGRKETKIECSWGIFLTAKVIKIRHFHICSQGKVTQNVISM